MRALTYSRIANRSATLKACFGLSKRRYKEERFVCKPRWMMPEATICPFIAMDGMYAGFVKTKAINGDPRLASVRFRTHRDANYLFRCSLTQSVTHFFSTFTLQFNAQSNVLPVSRPDKSRMAKKEFRVPHLCQVKTPLIPDNYHFTRR